MKRRSVLAFFQKLPPCLVGIEACASAHHWSRELQALGHKVRLIPPAYVKPYVKRQKNDAADAEAICEAVTRANMRFVPTKTPEQQSGLVLHRTRHLFIRQQTAVINAIRAHLAEFGIVAPVGRHGVEELLNVLADPNDKRVPEIARACLSAFGAQLRRIKEQVLEFDRLIRCACRNSNSHVQMMKSAEKRRRQNATNGMYCSRRWRVLVDRKVRAQVRARAMNAGRCQRPGEDWARAARCSSRHLQARAVHRRGSGDSPLVARGPFTVLEATETCTFSSSIGRRLPIPSMIFLKHS